MKLDKFLDWDGYKIIDAAVSDDNLHLLCQNDIFYLRIGVPLRNILDNEHAENLLENLKEDKEAFWTLCEDIERTGRLISIIEKLALGDILTRCTGPYLRDPDYYRMVYVSDAVNDVITVKFRNRVNTIIGAYEHCNLKDLPDTSLEQVEKFAREKLKSDLPKCFSKKMIEPGILFNLEREDNFRLHNMYIKSLSSNLDVARET